MSAQSTVTNLFLSPHLDDAVLSCGLRLLQAAERGEGTCVATLFSKGWPLDFGPDLYAGRHREDRNAVAALGKIEVLHLGYKDAIFRHLYYTSFARIILGDDRVDRLFQKELESEIGALIAKLQPQNIFLPLAVGRHIDHRNTHRLWCYLADTTSADIFFYEDRPYSFLPGNLAMRLHEIGPGDFKPADAEELQAGMAGINFYRQIARNERDRDAYIAFARAQADKQQVVDRIPTVSEERVESNDPVDLQKIGDAILAYTSQMRMLYGDRETFLKETAEYNKIIGSDAVYAERYWRLRQLP